MTNFQPWTSDNRYRIVTVDWDAPRPAHYHDLPSSKRDAAIHAHFVARQSLANPSHPLDLVGGAICTENELITRLHTRAAGLAEVARLNQRVLDDASGSLIGHDWYMLVELGNR